MYLPAKIASNSWQSTFLIQIWIGLAQNANSDASNIKLLTLWLLIYAHIYIRVAIVQSLEFTVTSLCKYYECYKYSPLVQLFFTFISTRVGGEIIFPAPNPSAGNQIRAMFPY